MKPYIYTISPLRYLVCCLAGTVGLSNVFPCCQRRRSNHGKVGRHEHGVSQPYQLSHQPRACHGEQNPCLVCFGREKGKREGGVAGHMLVESWGAISSTHACARHRESSRDRRSILFFCGRFPAATVCLLYLVVDFILTCTPTLLTDRATFRLPRKIETRRPRHPSTVSFGTPCVLQLLFLSPWFCQETPSNASIPAYPMLFANGNTTDLSSAPSNIGIMLNGVAMFRWGGGGGVLTRSVVDPL